MSSTTIRTLKTPAEVEEVRPFWSTLPSHRDCDIDFCLESVWSRREVLRPHVIVLYRNETPVAMLVGRLERTHVRSKIGFLHLPGVWANTLVFSYKGLLGSASLENSEHFVTAIVAALRLGEADMALLEKADKDSSLFTAALTKPSWTSRDHIATPAVHHLMALSADFKSVYRGLSGNHRSELKRKAKKMLADHPDAIRICCYRQASDLESIIPQIEEVATKSYQRQMQVGFVTTDEMLKRLRFCAEKGWLLIYMLYVRSEPVAFWIGTVYEGSFCSDYLAFDPRYADYSPGTFLLTRMIEEFCKAGTKEIDFGFGESRYKERFGNRRLLEASVCICAPTLKGLALNTIRTVAAFVDVGARKTLDNTNMLPRLKRVWRRRIVRTAQTVN